MCPPPLTNREQLSAHNVIWSNECRSGKCGIDDDQRGHLLVLHLVDVGLVLVGELLVVPLGQDVAPSLL